LIVNSVTKEHVEYNSVQRWDGKYPTALMGGGEGVLLSLPVGK